MSTAVALRFVWSAGNATLTTVPSMKAMLEARIVAASTQRPRDFEHGAAAGRERTTFSSHGSRTNAHMMLDCHRSLFPRWHVFRDQYSQTPRQNGEARA